MAGVTVHNQPFTPSVNAGVNKYSNSGDKYLQVNTMIGEDFVEPGLSEPLENFYHKSKPEDKAKCLELLTAINIQREIQCQQGKPDARRRVKERFRSQTPGPLQSYRSDKSPENLSRSPAPPTRPKTAMAASTQERAHLVHKPSYNYQTTYKCEYTPPKSDEVRAWRPRSTKHSYAASHKLSGNIGETTYNETYIAQDQRKGQVEQQAHEFTRNIPHPDQNFMVWRFPRKSPKVNSTTLSKKFPEGLTYEMMEKIIRGKCRSTYSSDYNGIPQGFDVSTAFKLPPDWRDEVPYTLNSSTRHAYQMPPKTAIPENITRFGCNKKKHLWAVGAIPEASTPYFHLRPRTTYDREFIDRTAERVADIRDVSKSLGVETLQRQMNVCEEHERDTLKKMMETMKASTYGQSVSANPTYTRKRKGDCKPSSMLSTWAGPI